MIILFYQELQAPRARHRRPIYKKRKHKCSVLMKSNKLEFLVKLGTVSCQWHSGIGNSPYACLRQSC